MSAAPLGVARADRPDLRLLTSDEAMTEPGTNGGPATIALVALEGKRVDDLVAVEIRRQDDLRSAEIRRHDDLLEAETRHRSELVMAESKRLDAIQVAEARRLDALLAAQNTAVAIAATRAEGTALALAERVDTAAKTLAAEAGSKEQRTEGRATSQWTFQQALTLLGLAAGAIYFLVNSGAAK